MSETVTHAEIEDVLSSIRRLVTSNAGSAARGVGATGSKNNGRLVLTPALRVAEPGAEPLQDPVLQDTALQETVFEDTAAQEILPEPILELAAEPTPAVTMPEVNLSEPHTPEAKIDVEPEIQTEVACDVAPEEASVDRAADTESDTGSQSEDAPWRDPSATLYAAAVNEGSVSQPAQEPAERIGTSHRVVDVVRKIAEIETAHQAGAAVEGGEHWAEAENEDETDSVPPVAELKAEPVDMEIPRPEAAPNMVEAAATSPTDEVMAAAATDMAQSAVEQRALEAISEQDAFLDENSLRELVADIVRQELQGALGERITRNVRKLVRREIQRALASQELF